MASRAQVLLQKSIKFLPESLERDVKWRLYLYVVNDMLNSLLFIGLRLEFYIMFCIFSSI